ncbi:MAG: nitroreductase family protein [Anaerolineae bacterium]|nr:nitroreductase family protein [Anaerolineae bacterium]
MDALEMLFTRRSIRRYTDDPVSEDMIKTILDAGMNAPSANNRQPWHFVVVTEREKLDSIMQVHPYSQMLSQAPVAIVVCGDTTISSHYWTQDCSAATENILLAARALGLGTVWLGVHPQEDRSAGVSRLFNLPDTIQPLCIIALGYPAEEKGHVDRYKEERVHKNVW